jgi:hypothetical protein
MSSVRVYGDFAVPVCKLKGGKWREMNKMYFSGEWLSGCFIDVRGRRMFHTGKFLLSPSHLDRVKYSGGDGLNFEELDGLLQSAPVRDLHDPYGLLS